MDNKLAAMPIIDVDTDFPQPACLYPSVQDYVQRSLGELPAAVQRKILYQIAANVYQLDI